MVYDMTNRPNNLSKPNLATPSSIKEILVTIVFVVAVTVLFDLAIPRSLVDGQSMEPTFHNEDRLIISRLNYLIDRPHHGDVIIFNAVDPRDAELGLMLVKRVIGIPGDSVEIQNQQVLLNGVMIDEPYIYEACSVFKCQDDTWILGDDEYFVMGDNRNHSNDSRSFDTVPFDHIIGQVVLRYWPLSSVGVITK